MASSTFRIVEHRVPCQHIREYPRALLNKQEDVLQLAVKQYIPQDNTSPKEGDLTIIAAHANGFPKELYEPLWVELHQQAKNYGFQIRGIWIADVAQQGLSSVLNEENLGNDPNWFDHSRDLLSMINVFRDQITRPILGIAHSMGACQIANLALMHPRLFTGLALIEPVISNRVSGKGSLSPARMSAVRRDVWPSRAIASASFKKSKFYQTWDPRVLELWIKYGLRELPTQLHPRDSARNPSSSTNPKLVPVSSDVNNAPISDPGVTLTTTKHQEVFTFIRPNYSPHIPPKASQGGPWNQTTSNQLFNRITHPDTTALDQEQVPFYRPEPIIMFNSLPHLRPHVLYIHGEQSDLSILHLRSARLDNTGVGVGGSGGVAEGAVKEHLALGVGHLVPFERVKETAIQISAFIADQLSRWEREEAFHKKEWEGLGLKEKTTLGERWDKEMVALMGTLGSATAGKAKL